MVSVGIHQRFGGAICLLYLFRHFTREAAHTDTVSVLSGNIIFHNVLILLDCPEVNIHILYTITLLHVFRFQVAEMVSGCEGQPQNILN